MTKITILGRLAELDSEIARGQKYLDQLQSRIRLQKFWDLDTTMAVQNFREQEEMQIGLLAERNVLRTQLAPLGADGVERSV